MAFAIYRLVQLSQIFLKLLKNSITNTKYKISVPTMSVMRDTLHTFIILSRT